MINVSFRAEKSNFFFIRLLRTCDSLSRNQSHVLHSSTLYFEKCKYCAKILGKGDKHIREFLYGPF